MKLIGEGKYNLNTLKEIKVTESYLGIDRDVRACQNIQTIEKCRTQKYIRGIIGTCGCLPLREA